MGKQETHLGQQAKASITIARSLVRKNSHRLPPKYKKSSG